MEIVKLSVFPIIFTLFLGVKSQGTGCNIVRGATITIGSYYSPPLPMASAEDCCAYSVGYEGWIFNSTSSTCVATNSNVIVSTNGTAQELAAGFKSSDICYIYPEYIAVNVETDNLGRLDLNGVDECLDACATTKGCRSFTHFTNSNVPPRCFLHAGNAVRFTGWGTWAGVMMNQCSHKESNVILVASLLLSGILAISKY